MEPGDNGLRERVSQTERRLNDAENARRRLWEKAEDQGKTLAVLQRELEHLGGDIGEIKGDCSATRTWVEVQIKERKEEEAEKQRLSKGQWAAVLVAATTIISSLIAAFAGLASAGVI